MQRTEDLILYGLLYDEDYMREVFPHLKEEYFHEQADRILFDKAHDYIAKYNKPPTPEALVIAMNNDDTIGQEQFDEACHQLASVKKAANNANKPSTKYMRDETEKFCQETALYNAVRQSIMIIDGRAKNYTKEQMPELLREALGVTFDTHVGHDYLRDHEERYEFYHDEVQRIKTGLDYFDKITKGGFPRKTLNMILAGTNVGKTLAMCALAGNNLMDGYNVLYVTAEMAEMRIAERIDANLLNVDLDDIPKIDKIQFKQRIQNRVEKKTQGRLIVKEYPTGAAHVGHLRHTLKELEQKENFTPDIIYVDYLGIMASQRVRLGGSVNSYIYVKLIAEELRGLAKEFDVPIVSGAQVNRGGQSNAEIDLEDTAESFGLPQTADFMLGLVETDELAEMGQFLCKQLKNRYRDKGKNRKFVIGVEKSKQRLFDLDDAAQQAFFNNGNDSDGGGQQDDKPVFDAGAFGDGIRGERREWGDTSDWEV